MEQEGLAPDGAYPAMEGTSGVAEYEALRGAAYEAALEGVCRVRGARRAGSEKVLAEAGTDGTGYSSPDRHERATRGVRVDRVGAKLPPRAIAMGDVAAP